MTPLRTASPLSPRRANANPTRLIFSDSLTNGARFLQTAWDPAESLLPPLHSLALPRTRYRCLRGRLPRPLCMPESASDRINDRKKHLESKPERAKEMALVRAREAIGVLRELEIDDDAILNELGFRAKRAPKKAATDRSGPKLVPLVSKQHGCSSTARLAAHKARQAR